MTNIVYIISSLRKSGPVNVLFDICKNIHRDKFTPIIVTLKNEDKTRSIIDKFENLGISIIKFNYENWELELFSRKIAKEILKSIPSDNPCVIHAHCYHASLISSHIKTLSSIETIHCIADEEYPLTYGRFVGRYLSWNHIRHLKKIEHLVVISDYMQNYYQKKGVRNLSKIYNGVDFRPQNNSDKDYLRTKLGLPSDKIIILYSGYFSIRKNAMFILSELKKSANDDFLMVLIGKGDLLNECKEFVNDDQRFRFEGYVFNVIEYLMVSDIYISASKSEGFPLAVLEALNMGIPSLLSSIPPHEEIVAAMNIPGVCSFDLEEDELLKLFKDMYKKTFDKDLISRTSISKFSSEVMTSKYEQLYKSCLR